MRHLLQYTTNKWLYEAFGKHVQVLWHEYFELTSLIWICYTTLVCVDQTGRKKRSRRKPQLDEIKLNEYWWKDGEKGETEKERNDADMGISMSSNGRTMTLLHLPLNPIRAPSSALAGSVIPHLYPPKKKKKARMWSNAHLSGRWSWDSSHMYSMGQTMLLLGVVVSFIAMFVVKMGVMLSHLRASFYLLLWDVFCKSVIWILSHHDS